MKTTLEFNEEEEDRAKMAINGDSAHYALQEIDQLCRNWTKHQDLTEEEVKRLDMLRDLCQDFCIL
jgi:uncharacterized protein YcbK (DUF882 family)